MKRKNILEDLAVYAFMVVALGGILVLVTWFLGAAVLLILEVLKGILEPLGVPDLSNVDDVFGPLLLGLPIVAVIAAIMHWFDRRDTGTSGVSHQKTVKHRAIIPKPGPTIEAVEFRPSSAPTRARVDAKPQRQSVAGLTRKIFVVQTEDSFDFNYHAIVEQMAPSIGLSYKHDVADDCEISAVQGDPESWDFEKLKAAAIAKWPEFGDSSGVFFDYGRGDGTILGSIRMVVVREPKAAPEKTKYRYHEDLFPWETPLSILVHANYDDPFTEAERDEFKDIINLADLSPTTGYDVRVYTEEKNVQIDPVRVQFYDASELHDFMEKIEQWVSRARGKLNVSPSRCPACAHFTRFYEECQVCGHLETNQPPV